MRVERVVLDTNVLISAVLSPLGKPFARLSWALDNAVLIVSPELFDELETSATFAGRSAAGTFLASLRLHP
jgi:predicted nucleic acid-binding protein